MTEVIDDTHNKENTQQKQTRQRGQDRNETANPRETKVVPYARDEALHWERILTANVCLVGNVTRTPRTAIYRR